MFADHLHAMLPYLTKEQLTLLLEFIVHAVVILAMIFAFVFYLFGLCLRLTEQFALFVTRLLPPKYDPILDPLLVTLIFTVVGVIYLLGFVKYYNFVFY